MYDKGIHITSVLCKNVEFDTGCSLTLEPAKSCVMDVWAKVDIKIESDSLKDDKFITSLLVKIDIDPFEKDGDKYSPVKSRIHELVIIQKCGDGFQIYSKDGLISGFAIEELKEENNNG